MSSTLSKRWLNFDELFKMCTWKCEYIFFLKEGLYRDGGRYPSLLRPCDFKFDLTNILLIILAVYTYCARVQKAIQRDKSHLTMLEVISLSPNIVF